MTNPLTTHLSPSLSFLAPILARECDHLARSIDDLDESAVVAAKMMLEEGDAVAVRRDANVAQVAVDFVERRPDWIFDLIFGVDNAHDREPTAIGRPIGVAYVLEPGTRRRTEREARECAVKNIVMGVGRAGQDRELTGF